MKNRISLVLAAGVVLAAAVSASADIPNPKLYPRPGQPSAEMRLRVEAAGDAGKEARLVIPRSVLRELQAGADGKAQGGSSAGLLGGGGDGAQTVVAGLFLSLAFVLGGVWLVRARRAGGATARAALGVVGLVVLCAGGAAAAYANIAPPVRTRELNWNILVSDAKRGGAAGKVRVDVVEEGTEIMLLLPKE